MSKFRVRIFSSSTTTWGRTTLSAVIDDAKDVGFSSYVNRPGECFFTLPQSYTLYDDSPPGIPLTRHIEISRLSSSGTYVPLWAGVLDGADVYPDEVVVYGRDYLSLLNYSISSSNTSYTSQFAGTIISDQLTQARAETGSRVNFITLGTIDTTTTTTTVLTSFQPRLDFIGSVANILMADRTVRSVIEVTPRSSATPTFAFTENKGSDREGVRLEYGRNVNDFILTPNRERLRTVIKAIGQQREGANILYSTVSSSSISTFGYLAEPVLFLDVVNQAALDALANRALQERSNKTADSAGLRLSSSSIVPWDGWDLADSLRVILAAKAGDIRGAPTDSKLYELNDLMTVWGTEWIGRKDGSEELFLDLRTKLI